MEKNKIILGIAILALIVGSFFFFTRASAYPSVDEYTEEITIYKDSSCGCCKIYGVYFRNKGNSDTYLRNSQDVNSIKDEYGIPEGLRSCHTTIMGDYFVEGHIPLEAVEKLLTEKPNIKGIAMPGMPQGSPGMPGGKRGDFIIYQVNNDGSTEEFMRI